MNLSEVLEMLRAKTNLNTATIYRKHGVGEETYGVAYAELAKLVKRIGVDHELALALWDTKIHDARVLATKIVAPERMTNELIRTWLAECSNYVINDAVSAVAARLPDAEQLAGEWITNDDEWTSAAGWNVYVILATGGKLQEEPARALVDQIRQQIRAAKNRTRHSMNNALIAIGGAMEGVREHALSAAREIGRVEVDHGETGCKTPDAQDYIARTAARPVRPTRRPGAPPAPTGGRGPAGSMPSPRNR